MGGAFSGACSRRPLIIAERLNYPPEPILFRIKRTPVHPGRILKRELEDAGVSANAAALALRIPANRLTEIINGKRSISADTAMRLGRYFGTSAQMWMNLQTQYELQVAEDALAIRIEREVEPLGMRQLEILAHLRVNGLPFRGILNAPIKKTDGVQRFGGLRNQFSRATGIIPTHLLPFCWHCPPPTQ